MVEAADARSVCAGARRDAPDAARRRPRARGARSRVAGAVAAVEEQADGEAARAPRGARPGGRATGAWPPPRLEPLHARVAQQARPRRASGGPPSNSTAAPLGSWISVASPWPTSRNETVSGRAARPAGAVASSRRTRRAGPDGRRARRRRSPRQPPPGGRAAPARRLRPPRQPRRQRAPSAAMPAYAAASRQRRAAAAARRLAVRRVAEPARHGAQVGEQQSVERAERQPPSAERGPPSAAERRLHHAEPHDRRHRRQRQPGWPAARRAGPSRSGAPAAARWRAVAATVIADALGERAAAGRRARGGSARPSSAIPATAANESCQPGSPATRGFTISVAARRQQQRVPARGGPAGRGGRQPRGAHGARALERRTGARQRHVERHERAHAREPRPQAAARASGEQRQRERAEQHHVLTARPRADG